MAGSAACDYEAYWRAYHVDILLYLTRIGGCRRKHSHEGGGADAHFGIVTNNLIAHALEGGDGARNLFVARPCLEHGLSPIDELYDEVDLTPEWLSLEFIPGRSSSKLEAIERIEKENFKAFQ